MTSRSLGVLTIDIVAKIGGFTRGMDQAARETDKRGKQIEQRLDKMRQRAREFGAAFGAALAAGATAAAYAVKAAIDAADALDEMSQRSGIAVETLSRLQLAAKFGAVEMSDLEKAIGRLAVKQQDYAEGQADAVALFDALGIAVRDARGNFRGAEDMLTDLADVFASLPDGAQKTALAIDLFGRAGQNLLPFLNQGGDRIRELNAQADALGITLSSETAAAAGQFNDQIDVLSFAIKGLTAQVMSELIGDLNALVSGFSEAATEGDNFSNTAKLIADNIRGVTEVAGRAIDFLQGLAWSVKGVWDFAAAGAAQLFGQIEEANRLTASGMDAFVRGGANFSLASGLPDESGLGGGPSPEAKRTKEEAAATRDHAAALQDYYGHRERAAAAARAQAEADRAAAEAARELERADAELERRLADMARQQADFVAGLDDLEAQMAGPLAVAELEHKRRIAEIQKLLDEGIITVDQATEGQLLYGESLAKTKDELSPYGEAYRELLDDMQFELDLLGKSNAERVVELELRRLGIDVMTEEGRAAAEAIRQRADALEQTHRQIDAMDKFRSSFADNVTDVLTGTKSIKDAFKDMADMVIEQIARMIANQWTESLFGGFGTNSSGSSGGWLSSLFGAFGGGRASGGPITAGVPYLVGEQGPELVIPKSSGTVIPAGATAQMLGGRSGGSPLTVVVQGATSRRSIDRIRIEQQRQQRRAAMEIG